MSRIVSPPTDAALADASIAIDAIDIGAIDIDAIVRRVLMQLRQEPSNHSMSSHTDAADASTAVTFGAGVCSLDDIKSIDAPVKQLCLTDHVVITPAARDELRRRGITVTRSDANSNLKNHPSQSQPGTRVIDLQRDGAVADGLFSAVEKQVLSRGVRLGNESAVDVILTSRPATTAHQQTGPERCVVAISRVDDVQRFMAELSPNVFVLDVAHLHLVALANCIAAIAKPNSHAICKVPKITVAGGLS